MAAVLVKAAAFVLVVLMGYLLKKAGFFHAKDFYLISRIVVKITLPAAIVSNFSKISLDYSLLVLCGIGIACNLVMVAAGYLMNRSNTGERKAFAMLNLSGYNIGNFTMPFVQAFLSPVGFAATSLFDAGNAVMCMGLTYFLAGMVVGGEGSFSFKSMATKLFSSIPFDVYALMILLSVCRIKLPAVVVSFADTAGGANAFLALFMLGIGFEIHMEKEKLSRIVKILSVRYGLALLMALCFFFFLHFEIEVKKALVLVSLGPITSVGPAFTAGLKGDVGLASAINSLSILISIGAITGALILLK